MDAKKQEIEKTLNSLDGIASASANPFLYEKIRSRILSRQRMPQTTFTKWAFALSIIILLNIVSWIQFSSTERQQNPSSALVSELGFNNNTYQY